MMKPGDLYLCTQRTVYDSYLGCRLTDFPWVDRNEYLRLIANGLHSYGMAATVVGMKWPRLPSWLFFASRARYLLVLDCDSEFDLGCATDWLSSNIPRAPGFSVVASGSAGHFWIVTDVIGSYSQVVELIRRIPGSDQRFYKWCRQTGIVALRGFPRGGATPTIIRDGLVGTPAEWLRNFIALHNEPRLQNRMRRVLVES